MLTLKYPIGAASRQCKQHGDVGQYGNDAGYAGNAGSARNIGDKDYIGIISNSIILAMLSMQVASAVLLALPRQTDSKHQDTFTTGCCYQTSRLPRNR